MKTFSMLTVMVRKYTPSWTSAKVIKSNSLCFSNGLKTPYSSEKESIALNSSQYKSKRQNKSSMIRKQRKCTAQKSLMNKKKVKERSSIIKCKEAITLMSLYKRMSTQKKKLKLLWMWKALASWQNRCSHMRLIFNSNCSNRIKL